MTTLELQLEQAYAKLLRQEEDSLKDVPIRLASEILNQAPVEDADEGEETAEMPARYILLRARQGEESLPGLNAYETTLMVEAGENADTASEDGHLDAMFRAAIRPFSYATVTTGNPPVTKTLFQALSDMVSGFKCFGMPHRGDSVNMEPEGSMMKRSIESTFQCASSPA